MRSLAHATFDGLSEGLICGVVLACVSVYFVVVPGVSEGDVLLTAVFLLDVAALLVAGLVAVAAPTSEQRWIGLWLAVGIGVAVVGDGLVALSAAGHVAEMPSLTAVLWAIAGAGLAVAARAESGGADEDETLSENWMTNRLLLPDRGRRRAAGDRLRRLARGLADRMDGGLLRRQPRGGHHARVRPPVLPAAGQPPRDRARAHGCTATCRAATTTSQALTGLATTMTETLEEGPIVDRGLDVLQIAARATSGAIHMSEPDGGLDRLVAVTGDWNRSTPGPARASRTAA